MKIILDVNGNVFEILVPRGNNSYQVLMLARERELIPEVHAEWDEKFHSHFIRHIGNLPNTKGSWWAIVVNDEFMQVGADRIELKDGDHLRLELRKIMQ